MKQIGKKLWEYTVSKPIIFLIMLFVGAAVFVILSNNITLQTNSMAYGKVTSVFDEQSVIELNDSCDIYGNIIYVYENRNVRITPCENFSLNGNTVVVNDKNFPYTVGTEVCIEYPTDDETLFHIIFARGGNY